MSTRCDRLSRLDFVYELQRWLEWPNAPEVAPWVAQRMPQAIESEADRSARWERREALGWTPLVRAALTRDAERILAEQRWRELVPAAYAADDRVERGLAWTLAPAVGVDLWEAAFERLTAGGEEAEEGWLYQQLLTRTQEPDRIRRVLNHAETSLPLDKIASGPMDQLGFGPEFIPHRALGWVVQEMDRPDIWSEPLLITALRSPVTSNRNAALRALKSRPPDTWSPTLRAALQQAAREEPDQSTREGLAELAARA